MANPSYEVMIVEAINALKERKGTSRKAILKYMVANYTIKDATKAQIRMNQVIRKMLEADELIGNGSFKLPKKMQQKKYNKVKKTKEYSKEIKKPTVSFTEKELEQLTEKQQQFTEKQLQQLYYRLRKPTKPATKTMDKEHTDNAGTRQKLSKHSKLKKDLIEITNKKIMRSSNSKQNVNYVEESDDSEGEYGETSDYEDEKGSFDDNEIDNENRKYIKKKDQNKNTMIKKAPLSEYEQMIERNKEANRKMLEAMGIMEAKNDLDMKPLKEKTDKRIYSKATDDDYNFSDDESSDEE